MPSLERTFEDLRDWLGRTGLLPKLLTQLAHLVPAGTATPSRNEQAVLLAQRNDLLHSVRCASVEAAFDQLRDANERLEQLQAALKLTPVLDLRRSSKLHHPGQTHGAMLGNIAHATHAIEDSAAWRAFPTSGAARLQELARRERVLGACTLHFAGAARKLHTLTGGVANFALPGGAELVEELRQFLERHALLIEACASNPALKADDVAAGLMNIARLALELEIDEDLVAQLQELAARHAGDPAEGPAMELLRQAWRKSERAWLQRDVLGIDPRLGFLGAFGNLELEGERLARWRAWLDHHAADDAGADPKDIVSMQLATCCTPYRWGVHEARTGEVAEVLALSFQHSRPAREPDLVPRAWME
jgi:hypothetical protein